MSDPRINVTVDTTQAEAGIEDVSRKSEQARQNIVSNMRRTAELGLLLAEASGAAIDEILRLQIQAGLRAIELAVNTQTLIASGTFGAGAAVGLGLQAGAIISMLITISRLRQGRTEAAQRSRALTQAFLMMTF